MNKLLPSILIWIMAALLPSCNEDNEDQTSYLLPAVETTEVTNIEARSALSGGNITDDRDETILTRGVCWSTNQNPTIGDNYIADETESESFLSTLSNLLPNTTYYVRAYATNTHGTGYGQQRIFTTLQDSENGNEGNNEDRIIYFWQEGNMPATTSWQTVANSSNPDGPDFRPHMIEVPANPNVPIKGAILICAGGAFQFWGNANEGFPVAQALSELGYQCFVVNYRLRPYTQQEGALDLARGVRYVGSRAENYGISENNIAVIGFSAGGILCGELLLNYKGLVNGSSLDSRYTPDALDQISADAIVLATPVYFYCMNAQLKTIIDRSVMKWLEIKNKAFNLIATAVEEDAHAMEGTIKSFQGFLECLEGAQQAGLILAGGVYKTGEITGHTALQEAYSAGNTL